MKIKTALISVSDKTGVVEFAKELIALGIEIISSAGTYACLKDAGVSVKEVASLTGFPEILGGRVKTLHPVIHGGILAKKDDLEHMRQLESMKIPSIDLVVVNLYPFEKVIEKSDTTFAQAIENIDIGGVALLRAAAKNFQYVTVLTNPNQYSSIIDHLKENKGVILSDIRLGCAQDAFKHTANYDRSIETFLSKTHLDNQENLPQSITIDLTKVQDLRYGENPHQKAAFYKRKIQASSGLSGLKKLHGKELSFNNILDLDATGRLLSDFDLPCACILKHTNPCGVAEGENIAEAFKKAHASDPLSAFGGIVGINRPCDTHLAQIINDAGFLECILAPAFDEGALKILTAKKNLRLLVVDDIKRSFGAVPHSYISKEVAGGFLLQETDTESIAADELKTVTKTTIEKSLIEEILFAWRVVKHVKSNAIVIAKNRQLLGVGSGVTSRVDAVIMACRKAGARSIGAVLASDAFFPKPDSITFAQKAGIKAIVQPGGSIGDEGVIKAANEAGIAMAFTGKRHFKH